MTLGYQEYAGIGISVHLYFDEIISPFRELSLYLVTLWTVCF